MAPPTNPVDRFHAAAASIGIDPGLPIPDDVDALLYGLYQQATVGPCTAPRPSMQNLTLNKRWKCWHRLQNMDSTEAMKLFVKTLEEEEPDWYLRVPEFILESAEDIEMLLKTKVEKPSEVAIANEDAQCQSNDIILEGLGSVDTYDQWVALPVTGHLPNPRYLHRATVLRDKMFIFGGNQSGHYLNDLQVLDLKSLTWSRMEAKAQTKSSNTVPVTSCAGHTLISWKNKILSIGGHSGVPSKYITVKEYDPQTCTWTNLETRGIDVVSRGGQSVALLRNSLVVIFGGEDKKTRTLLNDLYILHLETMR